MAQNSDFDAPIVVAAQMDTSSFDKGYKNVSGKINDLTGEVSESSSKMSSSFDGIGKKIAAAFAVGSIIPFANKLIEVRGEFQGIEETLNTIIGDASQASAVMEQFVTAAAKTPFSLQEVAKGGTQLLAFGSSAETVTEELLRLGDIAAGLNIPLNDLTYLYGTTMVQGRLYAQDLRQFMGRGIPLAEELAAQFGMQKDAVFDLVSAGKIGFPEIQRAIEDLTNEGGKFGGLMDRLSGTLKGMKSNAEDAIETAINDLAQRLEPALKAGLNTVKFAAENYEYLGKVIVALVATYGTYKAALIAVAAIEKVRKMGVLVKEYMAMGRALGFATANQKAFNRAAKANVYVAIASVVVGAIAAITTFNKKTEESTNKVIQCASEIKAEIRELDRLNEALNRAEEGTENYANAHNAITEKYDEYIQQLKKEGVEIANNALLYENLKKKIQEAAIEKYKSSAVQGMEEDFSKEFDKYAKKLPKYIKVIQQQYKDAATEFTKDMEIAYQQFFLGNIDGDTLVEKVGLTREKINELNDKYIFGDMTLSEWIYGGTAKADGIGAYRDTIKEMNRRMKEHKKAVEEVSKAYDNLYSKDGQVEGPDKTSKSELLRDIKEQEQAIEDFQKKLSVEGYTAAEVEHLKKMQDELKALKTTLKEVFGIEYGSVIENVVEQDTRSLSEIIAKLEEYKSTLAQITASASALQGDTLGTLALSADKKDTEDGIKELEEAFKKKSGMSYEMYQRYINEPLQQVTITSDTRNKLKIQASSAVDTFAKQFRSDILKMKGTVNGNDIWVALFGDLDNLPTDMLTEYINAAKEFVMEYAKGAEVSSDNLERYINSIQKAEESLKKRNPFKLLIVDMAKFQTALNSGDKSGANKFAESIAKDLQEVDNIIGSVTDSLSNMFGAMGMDAVADTVDMLGDLSSHALSAQAAFTKLKADSNNVAEAIKGVTSVIGLITTIISYAVKAISDYNQKMHESQINAIKLNNALTLLKFNISEEDYNSIFGLDEAALAADAYRKAQAALESYQKSVEGVYKPSGRESSYYKQVEASLQNVFIRSGKKGGEYLKNLIPEAFDEMGNLVDIDILRTFLETNNLINESYNDTARIYLENLIDKYEAYEAALDRVRESLQNTFGYLGQEAVDRITEAIRNGTDSWKDFKDAGVGAIEAIGEQMIYSSFFSARARQLEDELLKLYESSASPEDLARQQMELFSQYMDSMTTDMQNAQSAAEDWKKAAEEYGFKIWQQERDSAAKSTGVTATQESVDEWNARLTTIQSHTFAIANNTEMIKSQSQQIIRIVRSIDGHTEEMAKELKSVSNGISDIRVRGVIIRQ